VNAINDWLNTFTYPQALAIIFAAGAALGFIEGWIITKLTRRFM
jgi:ribose/xylose/arabinose/galactoside ABC-type transport system permease subunit